MELTRRHALAGVAALAASPLLPNTSAKAAAPLADKQAPSYPFARVRIQKNFDFGVREHHRPNVASFHHHAGPLADGALLGHHGPPHPRNHRHLGRPARNLGCSDGSRLCPGR